MIYYPCLIWCETFDCKPVTNNTHYIAFLHWYIFKYLQNNEHLMLLVSLSSLSSQMKLCRGDRCPCLNVGDVDVNKMCIHLLRECSVVIRRWKAFSPFNVNRFFLSAFVDTTNMILQATPRPQLPEGSHTRNQVCISRWWRFYRGIEVTSNCWLMSHYDVVWVKRLRLCLWLRLMQLLAAAATLKS